MPIVLPRLLFLLAIALGGTAILCACSPKFDWRLVRNDHPSYSVLMPAKPVELERDIHLESLPVTMHMRAAEVDGVSFAVGSVKLANAAQAQTALTSIKTALIANSAGTVQQEQTGAKNTNGILTITRSLTINGNASHVPIRMVAHLIVRDAWVFQVLVAGPVAAMNNDAIDTFISSFNLL